MSDYTKQRTNMVESQVRTNDVTDVRIENAMREVPRELFLREEKRPLAYADVVLQLGNGRFLLDPRTFSKLLQLAQIVPNERVLDVGCATGYSTAVLARIAGSVVGLEEDADLAESASRALQSLGVVAQVVTGRLTEGYVRCGPYGVIFINGAIEGAPERLLDQLSDDGRLVTVVRSGARSRAHIYVREHGSFGARPDFDAFVPVLPGFASVKAFAF